MAKKEPYAPADANRITREYLDSILIEERLIGAVEPDLSTELWGEQFETPLMTPAFSHLPAYAEGRENGLVEYARAAKKLGAVNWVGMMENDAFLEVAATGARTIRIVKPYADREKLMDQIACARDNGALAVGIDIDHIFGADGKYDVVKGEKMGPVSQEELADLVKLARIPFVVKGVLSVRDAARSALAGAKGLVISHHSGRMPYAIPPLAAIGQIRKAVGSDVKLFVDCGIRSGADAYKALALGADGVSIGRVMLPDLMESGEAGVVRYFASANEELAMIMAFTGTSSIRQIDPETIWMRQRIQRCER